MPKNKLLYYGLLVIAGAGLIYAADWLTTKIVYFVPVALGVGVLMIIGGLVLEAKKSKQASLQSQSDPPATP